MLAPVGLFRLAHYELRFHQKAPRDSTPLAPRPSSALKHWIKSIGLRKRK